MSFKKWLETTAVKTQKGSGVMDPPPTDDDDDGDGDDPEWGWEALQRRWALKVEQWGRNAKDKGVSKCRQEIIEAAFSSKMEVEVEGEDARHFYASVRWHIPNEDSRMDALEDSIIKILRTETPTLWKTLGVRLEDVWSILDKGDVGVFLAVHIMRGFTTEDMGKWVKFEISQRPELQREIDQQASRMFKTTRLTRGSINAGGSLTNEGLWLSALIYYTMS